MIFGLDGRVGRSAMRSGVICVMSAMTCWSSWAADIPVKVPRPPAPKADVFHPWQLRIRGVAVIPDGNSKFYDQAGNILPATGLSTGPRSLIVGQSAKISNVGLPIADVTYFLTPNFAAEIQCCVSRNTITGTGTFDGLRYGSTWLFPPAIIAQYHVTELGAFQPYIGAGPSYSVFFRTKPGNLFTPFNSPNGFGAGSFNEVTSLKIRNTFGAVGQIGFDYMINDQWGFNVDVKRFLLQPKASATVFNNAASPFLGPIPVRANIHIDPWMVGAGITYRFGGGLSSPLSSRF